jgi:hypothetical protein
MAVTNADILGWLNANPGASPALINQTMAEAGVSAAQYQSATGAPPPPVPQSTTPAPVAPPPPVQQAVATPAVSNADILGWFNANPNASDALIARTMQEAGVTPARLAQVTGAPVAEVTGLFQAAIAPTVAPPVAPSNPAVSNADILGWFNANPNADATLVNQTMQAAGVSPSQVASALTASPEIAKSYLTQQILGQGTTEKWTGEGKGSPQANAADMAEILTSIGITDVSQFGQLPDGSFGNKLTGQPVPTTYGERQTGNAFGGTFSGSGNTGYRVEFDASGKPLFYTTGASSSDVPSWVKPALLIGGALYGLNAAGLLGGAGAAGLTAAEAAGLGLTAAEASALGLSATEFAAATAGTGLFSGGIGAGLEFAGSGGAFDLANAGIMGGTSAFTAAELAAIGAGTATGIGGAATALGGAAASTLGGGATGALTSTLPAGVTTALTNAGVSTAVNKILGGGGTSNIGNLFNTGLTTGAGLLQQQTSREAAQRAQAMIDAETAAAKASAAFRPVGMTTRFGTSQFQVDPVTGQLTSAGYTLSPEAKAQQDRFMALSNAGLTQAEQAQAQFAPLQTGAQNLFNLGNQYIAQSPESVAQNYLNQQMALLQPGRELELANLQNRLQQQGRGGLAVAQGGAYGATTPELQALFNARAQQEAVLAAQAQQAGQQQVAFGAGLLNQGAGAMGQYYSGQQAAYAPYTTAMGQVQGLEALGQQPLTMGAQLGQTSSTAGARVGQLGLEGARLSANLATSADATRNLGAQSLIAAGNPNSQFGSAIGSALGGLFGGTPQGSLTAGFTPSSIAATEAGYPSLYY